VFVVMAFVEFFHLSLAKVSLISYGFVMSHSLVSRVNSLCLVVCVSVAIPLLAMSAM